MRRTIGTVGRILKPGRKPGALRSAADQARDARQWAEAERLYSRYLARVPEDAALWVQLGHARKELGDVTGAQEAYEQALTITPESADVHLQLGHLLKERGEYEAAITRYEQASAFGCADQDLPRFIADTKGRAARGDAVQGGSARQAAAILASADSARDARRWAEAARFYTQYLDAMPDQAAIWVQLGHAEKEQARMADARRAYERARQLSPDQADIHLQLGHLLKLLGEGEGALICYERALRLDPTQPDAFREVRALGGRGSAQVLGASVARSQVSLRPAHQPGALAIFTIASNNYFPHVRVLLQSVREHYPEARFFLCVADREALPEHAALTDCEVVLASDLGIPDFENFAFRYDQLEFCTALKPFMFRLLLDRLAFSSTFYLDPDIKIFGRSENILQSLWQQHCLVLTPHLRKPSGGHVMPTDLTIMQAGIYNLGFVGASARPETFTWLDWWANHLLHDCRNRPEVGLFVDQKFFDLLPGFTSAIEVSRHPGQNLAYWNLTEHTLTQDGDVWEVDGAPLQFFHFSGFNPGAPDILSRHTGMFAPIVAPALRALTSHYADALFAAGYETYAGLDYSFGRLSTGAPIPKIVTNFLADELGSWPGDPFAEFLPYALEPIVVGGSHEQPLRIPRLARYVLQKWPLLATVIDVSTPAGVAAFRRWLGEQGGPVLKIEPAFLPSLLDAFDADERQASP